MELVPAAPTLPDDSWQAVVARLAHRFDELTTDELEQLSQAHWWCGELTECTRVDERLYERYLGQGRTTRAADRALRLVVQWANRGDLTVASAWLARAQRLVREEPRGPVHGYASYVAASVELDCDGDPAAAAAAAAEIEALARTYPDPALGCFARAVSGLAAIRNGDLAGFTELDEAMLPVVSGRVDPIWAGDIYCSVIHLCEILGDLARMRSWTDALATWAAPLSATFLYASITRIHQLQLLLAEGEWDTVTAELEERSAGLADANGWLAGAGFYELGEVHRLRGRDDAAREAYARAKALGTDAQPGEALLMHACGDTEEALDSLRIALAGRDRLGRARLVVPTVEIALAAGEERLAHELADELAATAGFFGTPGLLAAAARARAACLADRGEYAAAVQPLLDAARTYREQRYRHANAQVHEALAQVYAGLGSPSPAASEAATAQAIYQRLGAEADLRRLAAASRPGGLTQREVEVLAQVTSGLSNKEVAHALVISEKTVSRHLGNIFTKLEVTTRTAAAAWAHAHGIGG